MKRLPGLVKEGVKNGSLKGYNGLKNLIDR